jgi:trigger factor
MNEACKREVSIEVPADVVAKETEQVLKKYQRLARIPGFRAGKVPSGVVKRRFANELRSEVLESLIPRFFRLEVDRQKLLPVSQPQVTDLHLHDGEPLRFKATFEVLPEIQASGYKELRSERKDISVSDDEVNEALQSLRERQATYEPVDDRPLEDGDHAQVSFTGTAKGTKAIAAKKAELEAAKAEKAGTEDTAVEAAKVAVNKKIEEEASKPVELKDVLVEIGGKNTVKDFSENLRGVKPGEERSFEVTYPDDFNDQRLAGQVMAYTVKVQGVKKKILPELNDDLAKELGEFSTLDQLKSRIRENMEAERKHEIQHVEKEKLLDELVKQNDFPVPQALIDRQIDVRLERGFRALAAQGMRPEDMRKMNFERLRQGQKDAALREVKASLLLDKIADLEQLDATEEDINRELEIAAEQTKQSVEVLRSRLTKEGSLDRIRDRIRNEKALDFIYSQSA